MDWLEKSLREDFDLPPKNPSEEAQRRWRSAVGALVKNRRRRFRMVADLDSRSQNEARRRSIQVLANLSPMLVRSQPLPL
jgi:Ca2+-transporting ATPase